MRALKRAASALSKRMDWRTLSSGDLAAPDDDAGLGGMAFVTQNGVEGGTVGEADVDGGPEVAVIAPSEEPSERR